MVLEMTKKTFKKIDKKGHEEIWEWDETPELKALSSNSHSQNCLHLPRDLNNMCYT